MGFGARWNADRNSLLIYRIEKRPHMLSRDLDLKITNQDSEWNPRYIEVAAMLFVTTLLLTAIVAPKIIEIGFLTISAATLVYPQTCVNQKLEVFKF